MIVAIYAYEGRYQGYHGINDIDVFEVENEEEAYDCGREMAEGVVDSFGLREEIIEKELDSNPDLSEDDLWEDIEDNLELSWGIAKVLDTKGKTVDELDKEISRLGWELFLEEYETEIL